MTAAIIEARDLVKRFERSSHQQIAPVVDSWGDEPVQRGRAIYWAFWTL
jgi:hypothetical protein